MEILQLRYFFESAKTESFAKTAEKYMVPQTSVSASIRRLEKELGCKLFDRTANRIVLNQNGKQLYSSLFMIFSELDRVVETLTYQSTDTREIKILVRSMRHLVMKYIIEYKKKYPNSLFKAFIDFNGTDFENYDIIIDEETLNHELFEKDILCKCQLHIKAAKDNLLCGRKLTLKQLRNQPFVSMGEGTNMHKTLINACKRAGFVPNVVVHCNDSKCYSECIAANIGIGLSRSLPNKLTENLDVTDFNEIHTIYCYYKKQAAYGNVEHFIKFLQSKMS